MFFLGDFDDFDDFDSQFYYNITNSLMNKIPLNFGEFQLYLDKFVNSDMNIIGYDFYYGYFTALCGVSLYLIVYSMKNKQPYHTKEIQLEILPEDQILHEFSDLVINELEKLIQTNNKNKDIMKQQNENKDIMQQQNENKDILKQQNENKDILKQQTENKDIMQQQNENTNQHKRYRKNAGYYKQFY